MDLNHCRRKPAGLQPAPFDRSGTPPHSLATTPQKESKKLNCLKNEWCWRWDLNPQPTVYKTVALPIELRQQDT